ncbi:MAG: DUF1552 domain-containing protein [Myxococcota bacterium]
MNRRQLLQALGLASGSLFLPSRAHATSPNAVPARRILFFVGGHGTVYDQWRMRPGGLPEDQDWEFALPGLAPSEWSQILAPLQPYADKLLVLDGLAHATSIITATNEHDEGHATCLSGHLPVIVDGGRARPSGASLDQILGSNRTTPFRTLEYTFRGGWSPCFDALGQEVPLEGNPVAAWNRLFPTGTAGLDSTEARVQRNQHRVLDLAAGRFDALIPTLSGADRVKLEAHRDLVRDLESQVLALQDLVCAPIPAPQSQWLDSLTGMATFQDLAVAALSCGLTDIVTIRAGDIDNADIGAPAGNLHNDYAHNAEIDPAAAVVMTSFHHWYAQRFVELLDKLSAIPEGGGTMLDHTIVVWTNELSTGSHAHNDMPIVIAGGSGFFDLGRWVRWAPVSAIDGPWSSPVIGQPHNKLLVTLAHAMGETGINQVGVQNVALDAGGTLDCTGPLDRVCV